MSMWQMPSDDICESDWLVGGGLFPLRALICFRAHQSFGDFFLTLLHFPSLVILTQPLLLDVFRISFTRFYRVT